MVSHLYNNFFHVLVHQTSLAISTVFKPVLVLCAYRCPGPPGDPGIDGLLFSKGSQGPAGALGDPGVRGPPGKISSSLHT